MDQYAIQMDDELRVVEDPQGYQRLGMRRTVQAPTASGRPEG